MTREMLIQFLRNIPQSNQDPLSLASVAGNGAANDDVCMLQGCALLLHTLGMVDFDEASGVIRARSQTAKYALASLAAYVEGDLRIIDDWKTRGLDASVLS